MGGFICLRRAMAGGFCFESCGGRRRPRTKQGTASKTRTDYKKTGEFCLSILGGTTMLVVDGALEEATCSLEV